MLAAPERPEPCWKLPSPMLASSIHPSQKLRYRLQVIGLIQVDFAPLFVVLAVTSASHTLLLTYCTCSWSYSATFEVPAGANVCMTVWTCVCKQASDKLLPMFCDIHTLFHTWLKAALLADCRAETLVAQIAAELLQHKLCLQCMSSKPLYTPGQM